MPTITVRIEDELKDRLERLAASTQRSTSYLAGEAIWQFVETNEWQLAGIEAALIEADADDFASEKDVEGLAEKWKATAG